VDLTLIEGGLVDSANRLLLLPGPKKLYGVELLDQFPNRRVLLVDSEATADAARKVIKLDIAYNILAWPKLFGQEWVKNVDWAPLFGRRVDIWPKAGEKPLADADAVGEILAARAGNQEVRILLQDGQPDGWGLADAIAEGWDVGKIGLHVNREGKKWIKVVSGGLKPRRGRPRNGAEALDAEIAAEAVKPPEERSAEGWWQALALQRNPSLIPHPTEANAIKLLTGHPHFAGRIWLNDFSQRLMVDDHILGDADEIGALIFMQQSLELHKMPISAIKRGMIVAGQMNKRHPIRLWLDSLVWDREPRLGDLITKGFGGPDSDYGRSVGKAWLTSMVARIYKPGCQVDTLPVFEGPQGAYKSTAMRTLGGEWFIESHADPIHENKAFLETIQGHWLIEIPEMHSIVGRGAGIEKIKGIISNRVDTYRVPYDTHPKQFPRTCVFCGTTNANAYLPDPTGARRFWPILCGSLDIGWIDKNKDQLFAEAVRHYQSEGCDWWTVPDAGEEQEQRRETDAWEESIVDYMEKRGRPASVGDILEECLGKKIGEWAQRDENRVSRALRANGYFRIQIRDGVRRKWVYRVSKTLKKSLREPGEDDF
jgi:hypothetical protein